MVRRSRRSSKRGGDDTPPPPLGRLTLRTPQGKKELYSREAQAEEEEKKQERLEKDIDEKLYGPGGPSVLLCQSPPSSSGPSTSPLDPIPTDSSPLALVAPVVVATPVGKPLAVSSNGAGTLFCV